MEEKESPVHLEQQNPTAIPDHKQNSVKIIVNAKQPQQIYSFLK